MVDNENDKDWAYEILISEKIIGIDTEFDWRNTYLPKLSLVQISTKNQIFLFDSLKINDLSFLRSLLDDKEKTIIMHSSRSDTTVLSTNLKINIKKVFDIQIAEQIIRGEQVQNYGSIVKRYFSEELEQSQTNSNWLKRPFSKKQIAYAAEDVNYLIPIYFKQLKALKKIKKLEYALTKSYEQAEKGNDRLDLARLKKLKKASTREKEIFLWRERQAFHQNIPPSYVITNKNLNKLKKLNKKDREAIKKVRTLFDNSQTADCFIRKFL